MSVGTFGDYGGQYVPEALMPAVEELADAYERYVLENEDGFVDELRRHLRDFGGRPTPLQRAAALSERYGHDVYLKREDLLHGGAHKLNNALGQVLLAQYMGKERIVAETGAGQHGTATAMACAYLDVDCEIYMGRTDINRQRPNVFRMRTHDAAVNAVDAGSGTLKEAINATLRDWATNVEDTHYVIGSVVGPHPFPSMVRDFQAVISEEAREQAIEQIGDLPEAVVACAGGGSNTMGSFANFLEDESVALYAVEAGGDAITVEEETGVAPHSASLSAGEDGVLHGARTKLLQTEEGQVVESHSVSAGLDYAGVGPELAHLVDQGRVEPVHVDDDAALTAFHRLSQDEGIIPALESSHAIAYLEDADFDGPVVVTLSGRGDKDLDTVIEESERRDVAAAPSMGVFTE
ncbi:tryptophan synthase subunit beta [Halanaeroarchaeum sulfurireducens]|uniref:Tryptophan synthase beta chain n=1 Tax=Halanaeroarchaeum sulfurireducens TaxID=1604004 RepID=A0A0F7P8N1_9EURY|nr:tryptophan synthase subunit beta [Halanaeroarchaeum sulfurireducens]AKH97117.1 tryptophan synthase subunit beta [Halanaeroarchaeum sulfurireducens]